MNTEQLNAIKERVAKATPGPWESEFIGLSKPQYSVINMELYVAHVYEESDAVFIAHSREDVLALVAQVERLQNRCELYEVARRNDGKMIEHRATEIERLRAELQDIIAVATEEASSLSYESGYEDIVKIATDALN